MSDAGKVRFISKGGSMNGFYWIYLVMIAFLLGYEFSETGERNRPMRQWSLGR